ncbi:GntR family transcriptional regulator [Rhizobium cauense]|nr:GntR family transcriptional regulator [Rhizobium cauense]
MRAAIVSRRFAPGSRLTESQLSGMLGISRGTVRSALQKLLTEGLVSQRPYASWEVTGFSAKDAWELYTLRAALEGLAAEIVADAIGRGSLDPAMILRAFEDLKEACSRLDVKQADIADFAFHKIVVSSADHRRLQTQYDRVDAQIQMLIVVGNEVPGAVTRLVGEHQPLLNALLAGDGAAAGSVFRSNVTEAGRDAVERWPHLGEI